MAELVAVLAAMAAGKSFELDKVASSYERKGKSVLVLTTDGSGKVVSRAGIERSALPLNEETNLFELVEKTKCKIVLIDEAQFMSPEKVEELTDIVDAYKIPVYAYGLKSDFRNELFPGSSALIAHADSLRWIESICAEYDCDGNATHNMRLIDGVPVKEGPQVLLGREDSYKAVCRQCYKKAFIRKEEAVL